MSHRPGTRYATLLDHEVASVRYATIVPGHAGRRSLNIVGMALDLIFWRHENARHPSLALRVDGGERGRDRRDLCLPKNGKPWIASVTFVLSNMVAEIAIWRASTPLALWAMGWAPFQAEKLGLLAVAVLAPPDPWAGAISIGIFAGSAMRALCNLRPGRARALARRALDDHHLQHFRRRPLRLPTSRRAHGAQDGRVALRQAVARARLRG